MAKLFVAADLPEDAVAALVRLQPPPAHGVRLPAADQTHLTLHYVGEADLERTGSALAAVDVAPVSLDFEGVGRFDSADSAVTLWAGVKPGKELLGLHSAVAEALSGVGFRPESRPYTPHVTIARCGPGSDGRIADEFLARNGAFSLGAVRVSSFGLYSSAFVANAPVYRRERSFRLRKD